MSDSARGNVGASVPNASLEERVATLRALPYFATLDEADLQFLAGRLSEHTYAKGETVFLEGEPCQGLYVVREGRARIYKLSPEGREQVLRYATPGQSFNEVAVFDGKGNPANVGAATLCVMWIVPTNMIWEMVRTRSAMAVAIIQNLGAQLRQMVSLVESLSLRQVAARLAQLLLETATNNQAPQFLTQQEMAARLGTVREMVGRSLKQMETNGLIKIEHGHIVIIDRDGLARLT